VIGSMVEFYDFQLYGASAAIVFSRIFFAGGNAQSSVILAFLSFGAGFLARPFGGIVFGQLGDRIGRRPMLVATLALMSLATTCIGLLPSAASFGSGVVLILIGLRFLQGFGAGAEYAGAVLLATESSRQSRHGLAGSMTITGCWLGSLLALAAFSLCSSLPEAQFLEWGWRLPFLLNIGLAGVGLWIRSHVPETPEFQAAHANPRRAEIPLLRMVALYWREILVAMGSNAAMTFYSYILQVYGLHYMVAEIGISPHNALIAVAVAYVAAAVLSPLWGMLCDRIGAQRVYLGGAIFSLLYVAPLFMLLDRRSPGLAAAAIAIGLSVGLCPQFAAQASYLTRLFPVEVRFRGMAFSREVSAALMAGPGPAIAAFLVARDSGHWGLLALSLAASSALTIVSLLFGSLSLLSRPVAAPARSQASV
jgi:MHS family shikimate/dehydroshikimate transporter-like MFS transporter